MDMDSTDTFKLTRFSDTLKSSPNILLPFFLQKLHSSKGQGDKMNREIEEQKKKMGKLLDEINDSKVSMVRKRDDSLFLCINETCSPTILGLFLHDIVNLKVQLNLCLRPPVLSNSLL